MSNFVRLRDMAPLRLSPPPHERWVDGLRWLPLSPTELHLACRYFPLAVKVQDDRAGLGLLLDKTYITHNLLTAEHKWRGAYRPIALRCFPFQALHLDDDPLADIVVSVDSEFLSPRAGTAALIDDKPNAWVSELHGMLQLLKRGENSFASAIDQLFIADLLKPLTSAQATAAADDADLYVLSPQRFGELGKSALGAMARNSFLSVDVAVACLFSLQNLKPEFRPKASDRPHPLSATAESDFGAIAIGDLPLALDDGELVPFADFVIEPTG